jgi:outer membrane protein assembly factor BamE (lipoprotein component of BamABCDE complex)
MKKISLLIFCLALLAGCATTGNVQISDPATVAKIEPGKTTKAEVRTLVGEPTKVNFDMNKNEVWEYVYTKATAKPATFIPVLNLFAGGADMSGNTLTILFDKNGVVEKVGAGKTTGEVRQ